VKKHLTQKLILLKENFRVCQHNEATYSGEKKFEIKIIKQNKLYEKS
jgi:hypothetical protein